MPPKAVVISPESVYTVENLSSQAAIDIMADFKMMSRTTKWQNLLLKVDTDYYPFKVRMLDEPMTEGYTENTTLSIGWSKMFLKVWPSASCWGSCSTSSRRLREWRCATWQRC